MKIIAGMIMIPMGIPGASIRGHLPAGLECMEVQVINEEITYLREHPLMTSDIRVGRGVQDSPQNGTL